MNGKMPENWAILTFWHNTYTIWPTLVECIRCKQSATEKLIPSKHGYITELEQAPKSGHNWVLATVRNVAFFSLI